MEVVYQSSNGWRICSQDDLFSSDTTWLSIYRYYGANGWLPFKTMGYSLPICFLWLYRSKFISRDEYLYQISLLEKKAGDTNGKSL